MTWSCVYKPKKYTEKLLELIKKLSKITKLMYKSIIFLYTSNALSKNEIKRTISFTIAAKGIKYSVIKWTKEVQNLHAKNYKTLLKKI